MSTPAAIYLEMAHSCCSLTLFSSQITTDPEMGVMVVKGQPADCLELLYAVVDFMVQKPSIAQLVSSDHFRA